MGDRFSGGFFGDDRDWSISEVLGGGLGTMHGELSDWTASGRCLSSRRFVCRLSMVVAGLPPGSSWPTPAAGPNSAVTPALRRWFPPEIWFLQVFWSGNEP